MQQSIDLCEGFYPAYDCPMPATDGTCFEVYKDVSYSRWVIQHGDNPEAQFGIAYIDIAVHGQMWAHIQFRDWLVSVHTYLRGNDNGV